VEKREGDIARCKKLLHDLPVGALTNRRAAMDEHMKSDDINLSELGAMLMEQKRIQEEIEG
jgi:hypothetical protein